MAVFFYLMTEGEMENRTGDKSARRTQRDYPLEFKEKVVREFESTDLSLSAISRKYGIQGESTVRRWLERYGTLNPEDAVLDRRFRSRKTKIANTVQMAADRPETLIVQAILVKIMEIGAFLTISVRRLSSRKDLRRLKICWRNSCPQRMKNFLI